MRVSRPIALVAAVAMLSACIAGSWSNGVSAASETLTIATVNNPQMIDMQHAVGDFEKKTGITVSFQTLPENTLRQKVTADVATGGGQFDIATVGQFEIPFWAKNKWIDDLQPYFAKMDAKSRADYDLADIVPNVRKAVSVHNDVYALPFYAESSMTYYNQRLFAAAHLTMPLHPTWDQITAFAKRLNDPSKNQYGICLRGLPGWGEMGAPLTTVINTFGGEWFNEQWQPQLTSSPTKDAIAFYVDTLKKYGEPGASSSGFTECETDFSQGKVAMWVDATSASGQVTDAANSKVAHDVGFAYSPTKVTPLGSHWLWTWTLAMESSSKHKDAAFKFLTWATDKHYIGLIASQKGWGNVPPGTRTSTFNNANYKRAVPYGNIILSSINTADPTHSTLHKVPYVGVQFADIPEFQQIGTQTTQNLAAAVAGSATVDAQLALSQQQAERVMTQAGYLK